ncbi:MAG: hypothetical protein Q8888_02065 [Vigna little leaf phytoplasma]|nr:hypothetical protein [Vigna little leaf phytoplasma]
MVEIINQKRFRWDKLIIVVFPMVYFLFSLPLVLGWETVASTNHFDVTQKDIFNIRSIDEVYKNYNKRNNHKPAIYTFSVTNDKGIDFICQKYNYSKYKPPIDKTQCRIPTFFGDDTIFSPIKYITIKNNQRNAKCYSIIFLRNPLNDSFFQNFPFKDGVFIYKEFMNEYLPFSLEIDELFTKIGHYIKTILIFNHLDRSKVNKNPPIIEEVLLKCDSEKEIPTVINNWLISHKLIDTNIEIKKNHYNPGAKLDIICPYDSDDNYYCLYFPESFRFYGDLISFSDLINHEENCKTIYAFKFVKKSRFINLGYSANPKQTIIDWVNKNINGGYTKTQNDNWFNNNQRFTFETDIECWTVDCQQKTYRSINLGYSVNPRKTIIDWANKNINGGYEKTQNDDWFNNDQRFTFETDIECWTVDCQRKTYRSINLGYSVNPRKTIIDWVNKNINGGYAKTQNDNWFNNNQRFTFETDIECWTVDCQHKKEQIIVLLDSPNPHTTIKEWKNKQNMSFIKASNYRYEGDIMKHTCETNTAIYHLTCRHDYYKRLQQWQAQCLFKPGKYTVFEIRDKLGRSDRTLYSDSKNTVTSFGIERLFADVLYYKYYERWLIDSWVFDAVTFYKSNRKNEMLVGVSSSDRHCWVDFSGYWDTSPPPTKPDLIKTFQ